MSKVFLTRRACGRSNQQVVIEHVRDRAPGTVFPYAELEALLSTGCDRTFDRRDVQQIVRAAKTRLLRENKRTLAVVPNVGYQLAFAKEHLGIANGHTKRGERQLRRAVVTLENARLDEMTAHERELHLAQCEVNQRILAEQRRMTSKQARHDLMIARLTSRVEQLEAGKNPPTA